MGFRREGKRDPKATTNFISCVENTQPIHLVSHSLEHLDLSTDAPCRVRPPEHDCARVCVSVTLRYANS